MLEGICLAQTVSIPQPSNCDSRRAFRRNPGDRINNGALPRLPSCLFTTPPVVSASWSNVATAAVHDSSDAVRIISSADLSDDSNSSVLSCPAPLHLFSCSPESLLPEACVSTCSRRSTSISSQPRLDGDAVLGLRGSLHVRRVGIKRRVGGASPR